MTRTDIHSPKNLVTEDYELLTCIDLNPPPPIVLGPNANGLREIIEVESAEQRRVRRLWIDKLSQSPDNIHGVGQCGHCGARFRYCAVLLHKPTGNVIGVGEQCLENRFSRATEEFQALRRQAELDREQHRIVEARKQFAVDHPELSWVAFGDIPESLSWNHFIQDVVRRFRLYGTLTEGQLNAINRTIEKLPETTAKRDAKQAERDGRLAEQAAYEAAKVPVVVGRGVITGVIRSVRQPDDYATYPTWKMLVEDDRHFKLWGSVPTDLQREVKNGSERWLSTDELLALKGVRVKFVATVEASTGKYNDETGETEVDSSFGFYSRPTKVERLES